MPFFLGALWTKSVVVALALLIVPQACGMIASAPIGSVIQQLGPASMRTTIVASYLFLVSLIGSGLGAFIMGSLSDFLTATYGSEALRYSLLFCGLVIYPLTSILHCLGGLRVERDLYESAKDF